MSAKVCSGTTCTTDDIARGIVWSVTAGADVINLSLGGPANAVVERAVAWARDQGVIVVAAAGNDSCDPDHVTNCNADFDNVAYPAAYPGVVAVTATDADGRSPVWTSKGRRSSIAMRSAA